MDDISQCPLCLQKGYIVDLEDICGSCNHYHRVGYFGDCRNNRERYLYQQFDASTIKGFNPLTRFLCVLCETAIDLD